MQRLKSFGEESDLVVEPIYGTKYKMEKIPEELIQEWATTMPKEDELLDYPPPNTFVPENIPTSKKAEKPDESERHTPPKCLREGGEGKSEVWFKQDDQFD